MSDPGASSAAVAVFAALLEARTGQQLATGRSWRVETALRPMLRERGLESLDQLMFQLLDGQHPGLADAVVEALLNGETSFFRDPAVFASVAELIAQLDGRGRVWCAGCSTGQEPLSLAMTFADRDRAGPEIIATDLSDAALTRARAGRFTQFEVQRGLPMRQLVRWFDGVGDDWTAKPELVRQVAFRRHNLVSDPALAGGFDAILCRNVLFYLAPAVRRRVLERLAGALRPGGVLVLGAGETVIGSSDAFQPSQRFRGLYEPIMRPWPPRAAA